MLATLQLLMVLVACTQTAPRVGDGPPSHAQVTALVAARDLPAGVPIAATDLNARVMPENYVPVGTFASPVEVVGRVPRFRILAHELVREAAMVPVDGGSQPSDVLPEGQRAVSIGLGGADPQVGERVDVWWAEGDRACAALQALVVQDRREAQVLVRVPAEDVAMLVLASQHPSYRLTRRMDATIDPAVACSR